MARSSRHGTEEITFVLFGAPGSGKSSTGNSILGEKCFKTASGTVVITTKCEASTVERFGKNITVIDTPGLTKDYSFSEIKDELRQIQTRSNPDKVVYALTIKIGRYTPQERNTFEGLFRHNKPTLKNCIIIFTNRNELSDEEDPTGINFGSWIDKNPSLKKLIKENGLTYLAFENKRLLVEENDIQVKDLLSKASSLDQEEPSCPVSEKVEKTGGIVVYKETLTKSFGDYGGQFYDKHAALQDQ